MQNFQKNAIIADDDAPAGDVRVHALRVVAPGAAAGEDLRPREAHVELHLGSYMGVISWDRSFCGVPGCGKMLLVLGCIGTDLCKQICVVQHFAKSTKFSS